MSLAATMRPSVSEVPPGANGTIIRTVFAGHVCAEAQPTIASMPIAAARIIIISLSLEKYAANITGMTGDWQKRGRAAVMVDYF